MVAALALAVPAVGVAAAAPAADASNAATAARATLQTISTCRGGTKVRHKPVKAGDRTVGYVNVHRYAGKRKCAQFVHAGPSLGKWRNTSIDVWTSTLSTGSGGTTSHRSQGILATGISCINARGSIMWNGRKRVQTVRVCTS